MITPQEEQHADKCVCKVNMGLKHDMKPAVCDCDGYHTFTELYKHRVALFAALCNTQGSKAWKSHFHHDGTMFNGMFIAGLETPGGTTTYHVEDVWWNEFQCKELDEAPEWDGHTADDVVERLKSIK